MAQIRPEGDENYWVHTTLGDGELKPHGPFGTQDEALMAAAQVKAVCHGVLRQQVTIDIRKLAADPMKRRA